jgi:hypothetical protein
VKESRKGVGGGGGGQLSDRAGERGSMGGAHGREGVVKVGRPGQWGVGGERGASRWVGVKTRTARGGEVWRRGQRWKHVGARR